MRQIQEASWGNTKLIPQRFPNRWVIMKLTTASGALPEGKVDAIFFDEELTGFGLRLRRGSGGRSATGSSSIGRTVARAG